MTRAQLKEEMLKLPEDDRRELLETLQDSLPDGAAPLPEWQRKLLDERLEDMERNPDDWVSLDEALESMRAKLLV